MWGGSGDGRDASIVPHAVDRIRVLYRGPRHGIAVGGLSAVLAVAAVIAFPSTPHARAATDPLIAAATSTYTVDPDDRAVHVTVDIKFTDKKPNTAQVIYYYRDFTWGVQPEATSIRVSDASGTLKSTVKKKPLRTVGTRIYFVYLEVSFSLRRNLFYGQSTPIRISYDLAGAPRSSSPVRVGQAFATFPVWASGQDGRAKVKVVVPKGFSVRTEHSPIDSTSAADGSTVLTAAPAIAQDFWVLVTAERESSYVVDSISIGRGLEVRLESFPEDTEWASKASETLRRALPELGDLIGLPWGSQAQLTVRERFVLDLATVPKIGYSPGAEYSANRHPSSDRIDASESLDPLTILGDVALAWFDDELVRGRWIGEGLAQEYAAQGLAALDGGTFVPDEPKSDAPGRMELDLWDFPAFPRAGDFRVTAKESLDRERYGRNASWYVAHQLVEEVGIEKMRTILDLMANDRIAYRGAGEPESVTAAEDWRRLLDLVEEVGGSTTAEALFRELALTTLQTAQLDERAGARDAYKALLADGHGWLPPLYVREPMDQWLFEGAQSAIADAHEVLDLRARVEAAAASAGVTSGPALKEAYQSATDGFDAAKAKGEADLTALAALGDARAVLDAPRDFVMTVGLYDEKPEDGYEIAVSAYERDDPVAALASAEAVVATLKAAPEIGRQRLLLAAGAVVVVLVVLLLFILLWRRRRRRRLRSGALPSEDQLPL
jgi:hypothetical protein